MFVTERKKYFYLIFYICGLINFGYFGLDASVIDTLSGLGEQCGPGGLFALNRANIDNPAALLEALIDAHVKLFNQQKQFLEILPPEEFVKKVDSCIDTFKQVGVSLNGEVSYVQKEVVPVGSDICIIGDIHGSIHSMQKILEKLKKMNFLNDDFVILQENFYFVFLGDYVDRGLFGVECWNTLLNLKLKNWDKVHILRGNHEDLQQNSIEFACFHLDGLGGVRQKLCFEQELYSKYENHEFINGLFRRFGELYNNLPVALFLGSGCEGNISWVQFCHGGSGPVEEGVGFYNPKKFLVDPSKHFEVVSDYNGFLWADFFMREYGDEFFPIMDFSRISEVPINFFITKEALSQKGFKAFFRGHQHKDAGLKILKEGQEEPISWKKVVSDEESCGAGINVSNYLPVFTFTTATEWGLADHTFFGILKTAVNYEDWRLFPFEIPSE